MPSSWLSFKVVNLQWRTSPSRLLEVNTDLDAESNLLLVYLASEHGKHSSTFKFLSAAFYSGHALVLLDAYDEAAPSASRNIRQYITQTLAQSGCRVVREKTRIEAAAIAI